jgi:hypothetical protein
VSHAGLVPAVRLADNVGLEELAADHVYVAATVGANPSVKIGSLVAGMIVGTDGIDGMDLLRHGAIPPRFGGIRAPSTLGSFLRAFAHGDARQLTAMSRRVLAHLAARTLPLPGADTLALVDIDSVQRRVYRASKQGAVFGTPRSRRTSRCGPPVGTPTCGRCSPLGPAQAGQAHPPGRLVIQDGAHDQVLPAAGHVPPVGVLGVLLDSVGAPVQRGHAPARGNTHRISIIDWSGSR